jgi:hypothetical protein
MLGAPHHPRPALPAGQAQPAREIAGQPCLPVNTVKTRMRHVYGKPGAHRHEATSRARGPRPAGTFPRRS